MNDQELEELLWKTLKENGAFIALPDCRSYKQVLLAFEAKYGKPEPGTRIELMWRGVHIFFLSSPAQEVRELFNGIEFSDRSWKWSE